MKVRLLLIAPKTVLMHPMQSTFSAATFSAGSTASYIVGAWQKLFSLFAWLLEGFVLTACERKCYVKSPNQESYLFDENAISTTQYALTCRIWFLRSFWSRNIFMQKIILNTYRSCVSSWRKILLTLFGDHIFHQVTMKIFQSPVGACLIKVISDPA